MLSALKILEIQIVLANPGAAGRLTVIDALASARGSNSNIRNASGT